MKTHWFPALRSPCCGLEMQPPTALTDIMTSGVLVCDCGAHYPFEDGVPDFRYPTPLLASDEEFRGKYDATAEDYDLGLDWLFATFAENESNVRKDMLSLLDLGPGARVLDLGCGTGKDSIAILGSLKPGSAVFAMDLSAGMLKIAKERLADASTPIEFVLGNGSYLPFEDGMFDAVFHFGGINAFSEIPRALSEMTRVTRPGGKVVFGDEGIAPWLRNETAGEILVNANPLYKHQPPMKALPQSARDVRLQWIIGNAFYLVDYRVGSGPPPLKIDVPIPGKGDTLRSRFELKTGRKL